MELRLSTQEQKFAHVNALVYIASADEKITESEKQIIASVSKLYGISDEEIVNKILYNAINKEYSMNEVLEPISERKDKILLINDLISLCFIDGDYSEKERKVVREISNKLEIETEKIEILERINNDLVILNSELQKELEI